MRLTPEQVTSIKSCVSQLAPPCARAWLFGSRVNDHARGGDVDLMIELDVAVEQPALLAAQVATRISRSIFECKVDVLIQAPNLLQLTIHTFAKTEELRL
jgi:predicted nucleotidyltransferase